jgi:hypothetical protein
MRIPKNLEEETGRTQPALPELVSAGAARRSSITQRGAARLPWVYTGRGSRAPGVSRKPIALAKPEH